MRKNSSLFQIILSFVLLLVYLPAESQTLGMLCGTTISGGDSGGGVLFGYDPLKSYDSLIYQFGSPPSGPQYTNLIQAADGNFYGMAGGGALGAGAIFRCTNSGRVNVIASFTGPNGKTPEGPLVQASDGNLYGMTTAGGTNGYGVLFRCSTSGILTVLVNFTGSGNGSDPKGGLIQASDGNLYGMTNGGGSSSDGTLFTCTLFGTLTTLVNFNETNGAGSAGSLIQASDGDLYGMTSGGGALYYGTLFQCTTSGTLTTLVNFDGSTYGGFPQGSLIQAKDGLLYGMTYGDGYSPNGTIFSCTTAGTLTTLVHFTGSTGAYPGSAPNGRLVQASDGNLYGMTSVGGTKDSGTIFQCTTLGNYNVLVNLDKGHGWYPYGSLIQASDGNLYGMTNRGSSTPELGGALFKCSTSGVYTILYNFGASDVSYNPFAGVIQAADGNLYGMGTSGGSNGYGNIFKCDLNGNANTLANFDFSNGAYPEGGLMQGRDGNLYGTTWGGGNTKSRGTIFKCTTSGVLTTIFIFDSIHGDYPYGSLIQGSDGNLYGMTHQGGTVDSGTIFQCTTSGIVTTLFSFRSSTGGYPIGGLVQGTDNNLYGMTSSGGASNRGTLFKCSTSGTFAKLLDFTLNTGSNPGSSPYGSLIQAIDGNLYGVTPSGGGNNYGTIFECTTSGILTTLYNFNDSNGASPMGSLIQASDSNLYGMTSYGGPNNVGVIFKCSLSGAFTPLLNFNTVNGRNPYFGSLNEVTSSSISVTNQCTSYNLIANVRGGGAGAYNYLWSTGATTSSLGNVTSAGTYSVTIISPKGISVTSSITVSNAALTVSTSKMQNDTCGGCATGSASVTIKGGNKNTISWSDSTSGGYVLLANHTSDTITRLAAGTYVCTVTDSCGNGKTDTIRIIQSEPTSIQTINNENGVAIFPIPSKGNITILINEVGDKSITIYSEVGKEVYKRMLNNKQINEKVDIDTSSLPDGIYFAQIVTPTRVLNKKIIIQR